MQVARSRRNSAASRMGPPPPIGQGSGLQPRSIRPTRTRLQPWDRPIDRTMVRGENARRPAEVYPWLRLATPHNIGTATSDCAGDGDTAGSELAWVMKAPTPLEHATSRSSAAACRVMKARGIDGTNRRHRGEYGRLGLRSSPQGGRPVAQFRSVGASSGDRVACATSVMIRAQFVCGYHAFWLMCAVRASRSSGVETCSMSKP